MKTITGFIFTMMVCAGIAQTRVTETVTLTGQTALELDFPFADDIMIKAWDKNDVKVEVDVTINEGNDDHIFKLETEKGGSSVSIRLDQKMWTKAGKTGEDCSWSSDLFYTVYVPREVTLKASTINGTFILEPYGKEADLKTISGDIDLTLVKGADFHAKTISGEVYSDLDLFYPEGKDGLHQIVGMNVRGRVLTGGTLLKLETISGNIYLRKGV